MHTSNSAVQLIQQFEGFVSRPYRDAVGVWTIGFGHTEGVGPHTIPINRAQAERLLLGDLEAKYEPSVRALGADLNQNQFDALVSFVYNLGTGIIGPNHDIGRALRAGQLKKAADLMLEYCNAGGHPLPGLVARRHAERALFLHPVANDPFVGYPADERRWIREFDSHNTSAKRRKVLREVMATRRKEIWRAAQHDGWHTRHRADRYRSLEHRTR